MPKDILFEIGTEELPATMLADLFGPETENFLLARLKKAFEEKRIVFRECRVWATPRRLVFLASGAAERQSVKENFIRILPKDEAYGPDGRPTEKFSTILKHRGASLDEIVIAPHQNKAYAFLRKSEPALATEKALPDLFRSLVKSLVFAKNMKWGLRWEDGSDLVFPRPIRRFLCLYGAKAVTFTIAGIPVKGETAVFLKGARKTGRVGSIPAYFSFLNKEGVLLDQDRRKDVIRAEVEKLARSLKGRWVEDPFLLNEVNFLVESPAGLAAPFKEEFLALPLEVLTVSMARKQRIFGVLDKNGRVMPRFLAVLDGRANAAEKKAISKNIEHILHAKLQDSLFFYKEDTRVRLDKKSAELKDLVFLKGAGSMLEKAERLAQLAKKFGPGMGLSAAEQKTLERAAFLSKADLLTHMVGEFPELQGVMGKYYALENGEAREVAEAVGEQYLPRTAQDRLPATLAGAALSLLDKCDLVCAAFGLGHEPSSSVDPFGLRRSATAVVKIALDRKLGFSLTALLGETARSLGAYVQKEREVKLEEKLLAFFKDRFKALLADRGYREDLIDAVTASRFDDLAEAFRRLDRLSGIVSEPPFQRSWKVVERTANILKGNREALPRGVDAALFTEELEREVFRHYEASHRAIRQATDASDYGLATSLYAEAFFDILGEFFEKVFVNAEDLNVRRNRLSLLQSIKELYTDKIADLSKIRPT
jgi:glycyl-tRNA synthetase beta chain